ncbi:MAG: hypothetical protein LBJ74_04275 [Heliobacteriaceae bacterium]|jgi:hypothetical protein|nr:hypothetical protein [Heliobacteriaceae bacterium]
MLNVTLPVVIGKPNKDGLREVTIRDGKGNNKVIEADKEKLDNFLKEKDRLAIDCNNKTLTGEIVGIAAGIGAAALTYKKHTFVKWFGAVVGGAVAGILAAYALCAKQLKADYQKAAGKLEPEVQK